MAAIGNSDELLATLGPVAFRGLVEVRGGTQIWVPASIEAASRLVQWLGVEAAQRLVTEFGGFSIDVPNLKATVPSDKRVIPLLNRGMTDCEIAGCVGVTERTVRAVRRRHTGSLPGSVRGDVG